MRTSVGLTAILAAVAAIVGLSAPSAMREEARRLRPHPHEFAVYFDN